MKSLFSKHLPPLADRVRPRNLDVFVGQEHLTGNEKILSLISENKQPFSMMFWGPPGSGKTTLARIIAKTAEADIHKLSAVSSGVKDLRKVISQGEKNKDLGELTVLFIDEIHRFSKSQQDSLLNAVEDGTVILIGATTENPSFEIISPLLSRCKVLVLNPLSNTALDTILDHAFNTDIILQKNQIDFPQKIREQLIQSAGGDARKMLNTLEVSMHLISGKGTITEKILSEALQRRSHLYDKTGDYHYDTISAFIKSVRGSDPDAAIYWLAIMIEGGEKPEFIARRLIILASEDISNADPQGLTLAVSGFQAVHMIGMPEAAIILAQVTTYLSGAPKSNASYRAIQTALEQIKEEGTPGVPLHLRNVPTGLMKALDYGKDYEYPHAHPEHFVNVNYFPDGTEKSFYHPTEQGYEKFISERLKHFWSDRYKD
ncbi:MAG: replication-associated recombination protein A [Candidatus Marinimicrobia bacterium]|jgi:putative ATPase|nr:replication-associated recombination protein A [Candidatus Neomarinimicrobiota bacterium]MDP7337051.1 replication-associated recombination protein A [Candidatus Neomarinimicrobiota bacterium]HJN68620.1 replication-associated recombination protein A [Candidatus Neomarinimicrobiota bacterium]